MRVPPRTRGLLGELLDVRPAVALSPAVPTGGAGPGQDEGGQHPLRSPRPGAA
jgi:hypothetical protein